MAVTTTSKSAMNVVLSPGYSHSSMISSTVAFEICTSLAVQFNPKPAMSCIHPASTVSAAAGDACPRRTAVRNAAPTANGPRHEVEDNLMKVTPV